MPDTILAPDPSASDPAARARHEQVGFFDGWGSVTEQLAALVESEATR